MIPFIRSLSESMAITESRYTRIDSLGNNEFHFTTVDSGQRKRYIRSLKNNEVDLTDFPGIKKRKSILNKKNISIFFDNLGYNNQIPTSYDLTLIAIQSKCNQKDVA